MGLENIDRVHLEFFMSFLTFQEILNPLKVLHLFQAIPNEVSNILITINLTTSFFYQGHDLVRNVM